MKPELIVILSIFVGFILLEIVFTGFFSKAKQKRSDAIVEAISTGMLTLITQPLVAAGGFALAAIALPGMAGMLESWPFLAVFALFLLFDDLTQYWWRRWSRLFTSLKGCPRLCWWLNSPSRRPPRIARIMASMQRMG